MNNQIHKLSGRFCPYCLGALWFEGEEGHQVEYCRTNPGCGYQVGEAGPFPAAPLDLAGKKRRLLRGKRHELAALQHRQLALVDEIAALERELDEMPVSGFAIGAMAISDKLTKGAIHTLEPTGHYRVPPAGENAPVMMASDKSGGSDGPE